MGYYNQGPVVMGSVSMVTATPGANDPDVGTKTTIDGNDYIFVYNAGNSQISVGRGAVCSAVTGYSVTVSSVASTPGAGMIGVCKHATLTTGTYGWLLTRGFANVATVNALAIGDGLCVGADGAFENASGLTGNIVGKAMSACASGTATGPAYFTF